MHWLSRITIISEKNKHEEIIRVELYERSFQDRLDRNKTKVSS